MSESICRTGGAFGGSFLPDHLLRVRRPRAGDLANYLDMAHYHRVEAAYKRQQAKAWAQGKPGQPPPCPPMRWERY